MMVVWTATSKDIGGESVWQIWSTVGRGTSDERASVMASERAWRKSASFLPDLEIFARCSVMVSMALRKSASGEERCWGRVPGLANGEDGPRAPLI